MAYDPQRIAADPTISAFVTANAGSGKTKTLIDRVARLLLAGVEPQAILCVTYTKAAAAEMQRRLFDRLGKWSVTSDADLSAELVKLVGEADARYDAKSLSDARALFAKALETPGGLKIQTIHAFCEKLLRRFPLEAGISPGFRVMDDPAAALILRADGAIDPGAKVVDAVESDWSEEYLAAVISIKVVAGLEEAIAHINHYSSHHTDAIVTRDHVNAQRFLREVDSASVMVNASTRFADGFEFGLGAEIGISTDKFHARGPVGIEGLTSLKYVVLGQGEVRT